MDLQQNAVPIPDKPKAVYTAEDTVFAWLSLLLSFLYCQALPVTQNPLGGFLLILALFASGFVLIRLKKQPVSPICILSAVGGIVVSSAMLWTDAGLMIKLSMSFALLCFFYTLYAAFGNRIEEGFSDYVWMDFIKILFVLPFFSFLSLFSALFNKSTKKTSGLLLKVLIGLLLAFFPTLLVLVFLSYDGGFIRILESIFRFNVSDTAQTVSSLFFSLPLAMYGFGLYDASRKQTLKEYVTAQRCSQNFSKIRILPRLTAVVSVLPILFLYAVFFISQWKYYVSAFTGVLPEAFSYAEYARQGFFELCAVSVINLILIVSIAVFIRREPKGTSPTLAVVASAFCLCTLILISTAVSKLVLYIRMYGLTQKRIYAMWMILLIGVLFLVIALGQYLQKIKITASCFAVFAVLFTLLALCNVNALCANYNAKQYLSGKLNRIDVQAMIELEDSAIPALVKIAASEQAEKDPALKVEIDTYLQRKADAFREEPVSPFAFSLPSARAKAALKDYIAANA